MKKVAFSHTKGGVGKSLLAVLFTSYLARLGMRVLHVDLDAQGDSSRRILGREQYARFQDSVEKLTAFTVMDILQPPVGITPHKEPDRFMVSPKSRKQDPLFPATIKVIPSTYKLYFKLEQSNTQQLQWFVNAVKGDFDALVVDCSPHWNSATESGWRACAGGSIVCPTTLQDDVVDDLVLMGRVLAEVRRTNFGEHFRVGAVVPNRYAMAYGQSGTRYALRSRAKLQNICRRYREIDPEDWNLLQQEMPPGVTGAKIADGKPMYPSAMRQMNRLFAELLSTLGWNP